MNTSDYENQALYLLGFADLTSLHNDHGDGPQPILSMAAFQQASAAYSGLLSQLRIESVRVGDILAWYKLVERTEFEGQDAASNLADLNWLTPRVLAHEAVVSKLCEYFALYPARFGCLFSTKERLVGFVARHAATLRDYFQLVRQRQEWGVKLVADVDAASAFLAEQEIGSQPSRGVNYLKLKQLTRQLRPVALDQLQALAQQMLNALQQQFPNFNVKTLSAKNSPDRQRVMASVALLLDHVEAERLSAMSHQWPSDQPRGLQLELIVNGPWPPYSFCPSLIDEATRQVA